MTTTAGQARRVKHEARDAANSPWVDRLGRLGLAARGFVYVMVGVLALEIAFGKGGAEADRQGALSTVASHPVGRVVVWLTAVGFLGYALWRAVEAIWGHRDADGVQRTGKRLASAFRAVLYAGFAFSTARLAAGGGAGASSDQHSKRLTAGVLGHTFGRPLVIAVGAGFVVAGGILAYRAVRRKFEDKLKRGQMSSETRAVVMPLGVAGNVARGVVFALVGVFLVQAAVTYDPQRARGLDGSLKALTGAPAGVIALIAVAVGLVCFGLFSFAAARYERTGAGSR